MEIQHSQFTGGSSARVVMEVKDPALTCPICLDLFTKPVRLPCGHNFCQSCILIVWKEDDEASREEPQFCPECQLLLLTDLKLEINKDLEQKVQDVSRCKHVWEETALMSSLLITCDQCIEKSSVAVKSCLNCDASLCSAHTLHHQYREQLRGHMLIELTHDPLFYKCQEHGEEQKLFCQDDQAAVCSLCVVFGKHKRHRIIQLQDACSDFKKAVEERNAELLQNRQEAACALQDLQQLVSETATTAERYRARIAETYKQIAALIVQDEKLMMDIIGMEELYTNKWLVSKKEALEQQIAYTDSLLSKSESVLQENDQLKLLQHLKRHAFSNRVELKSPELTSVDTPSNRMETVLQLAEGLHKAVFQTTRRLWTNMKTIHLDAATSHPNLEVSADLLEVCWSKENRQKSKNTEHISTEYSILAKESLVSGSHYWETAVWEKPYWLIGLSYECSSQAGEKNAATIFSETFCYIYHGNGRYLVCSGSEETLLVVKKKIQKVGVCVEIEKGTVSFYDADTLALLYLFAVKFLGPVRPVFNPCLCLNEKNAQALIVLNPGSQKES